MATKDQVGPIRMGTATFRYVPRDLVRVLGGKCRDLVPNVGGVWLMTRFTTSPILADSEKQDLRPWHVSVPRLLVEPRQEEGPVVIQIEYCVDPHKAEDFLRSMHEVRSMRD